MSTHGSDLPAHADSRTPRREVFYRLFVTIVATAVLLSAGAGCHSVPRTTVATVGGIEAGARIDAAPVLERVKALAAEIRGLSPGVDAKEAADLADHAIRYALVLAESYGMKQPVELHNVMVNMGLKKRGLCYQLADDLHEELKAQKYRTVEFQRAVAWEGDLWNEHNSLVVMAKGQPWDQGLVLDAWRNAGVLRWSRVKLDHYPWVKKVYAEDGVMVNGGTPAKGTDRMSTGPAAPVAGAGIRPVAPVVPVRGATTRAVSNAGDARRRG